MLSHIKETDESVPYRLGDCSGTPPAPSRASNIPSTAASRGIITDPTAAIDESAPEEVILDVNELAEDQPFMAVQALSRLPRRQPARLLHRHHRLPPIHASGQGPPHRPDSARNRRTCRLSRLGRRHRTLFYSTEDEIQKRHDRFFRHTPRRTARRRRAPPRRNRRALQHRSRPHPRRPVPDPRSRQPHHQRVPLSRRRQIPPASSAHRPAPRQQEYYPGHRNGLLLHPRQRHRQKLPPRHRTHSRNPAAHTGPKSSPTAPTTCSKTSTSSPRSPSPVERRDGLQHLRVVPFTGRGAESGELASQSPSPNPSTARTPTRNRIFATTKYRYSYQSLVTPASIFEYDIDPPRI